MKVGASLVAQLVKNLPAMWKTGVLIPRLGRSRGEGNSYALQYSGLENSMDCTVHVQSISWDLKERQILEHSVCLICDVSHHNPHIF